MPAVLLRDMSRGEGEEYKIKPPTPPHKPSLIEYAILFIGSWMYLTGLFASDLEGRKTAFGLLGTFATLANLTSYNRNIHLHKRHLLLTGSSLILSITGYLLLRRQDSFAIEANVSLRLLLTPIIANLFLVLGRELVRFFSGSYPITLDKTLMVKEYFQPYNRKAHWGDALWSITCWFGAFFLFYLSQILPLQFLIGPRT
jgi:hypothetical protein